MDLDMYRALKAEEQATQQKEATPYAQVEHKPVDTLEDFLEETGTTPQVATEPVEQTMPPEIAEPTPPVQPEQTNKITYDGQEYDVADLIKQTAELGTLRQNAERLYKENEKNTTAVQYFNKMMEDPEYAKAFASDRGLPFIDPKDQAVQELEQNYRNLLLERDIQMLQTKHADFDAQSVVQFALDKQIPSLEDAYILHKAQNGNVQHVEQPTPEQLKEQIRQEILAELQSTQVDTGSLIGVNGAGKPVVQSAPQLSAKEISIASEFGLSPADYAKYK